ncbi:MAG: hypothetical protein M3Z23_09150 [Acidobacteriota bacterium]|nr:hypothetical protein [Acidobacteriota bacterium]
MFCAGLAGAEKKPGVVRIAVMAPVAQMGDANFSDSLKGLLVRRLNGPAAEFVALASVQPLQVEAEIKAGQFDYLLFSSMTQKKSGGNMGMLRGAMAVASMVPMVGGMASMGGMIAAQAASVALSTASIASGTVKAKSEVTFEYKLTPVGSDKPVLANSFKAKAKSDGEDVITPMIDLAAVAIVTQVALKQ